MIPSGTTIDRIVRGWRSRWPTEICDDPVGSASSASISEWGRDAGSVPRGRG